jgi:hypothetical protein
MIGKNNIMIIKFKLFESETKQNFNVRDVLICKKTLEFNGEEPLVKKGGKCIIRDYIDGYYLIAISPSHTLYIDDSSLKNNFYLDYSIDPYGEEIWD